MGILAWLILGGLAGWIASILMKERQGCLVNIAVGIIGAFIGGLIFSKLGGVRVTGLNPYSLAVATLGAVLFIAVLRLLRGRQRR